MAVGARSTGRAAVALVFVLVGCLLAPLAVVGWFVRTEIVDGDHFVATAAPLARNADVQDAVVERVTQEVIDQLDARAPGQVTAEQVRQTAATFVASPQFQMLWDEILREAHPQLQQVLLGRDTDLVASSGGKVVLDLDELGRLVQQHLVTAGVAIAASITITESNWSLTLYDSPRLAAVQQATNLVQRGVPWAVAITIAAFVLALLVAPRRMVIVRWIGIGLLVGAVLVGAGLAVGRLQYLAAVDGTVPAAAAGAAYDVLLDPLAARVRVWFVVALVLVVIGVLAEPTSRRGRHAPAASPGTWVAARRGPLVVATLAVALGVLVWWNRPTVVVLAVTAGVVAAAIVAVFVVSERALPRRSRTSPGYDS